MADFKFSLNCSTIKPTPLMEKIAIAGEAGYTGIELWFDDIDRHLNEGGSTSEILAAVNDNGLKVVSTIFLKGWWDTEGAVHKTAMEECKRRMHLAAALRSKHYIAGPPLGPVDIETGAKRYRELLELGMSIGVKPSAEYLGFAEEFNTIEKAVDLINRCDHPAATIVHDPFHIFRGGGSIESVASLKPEQIAVFHFNDAPDFPPRELQHDPDRVMPGDGHLDLKRLLSLLKGTGYDGWISLELFNRDWWRKDPRETAKVGLERMRELASVLDE